PQKSRLHRDELPPPPKRWKDLEKHPFGQEFKAAAAKEFKSRRKKGCFKTTNRRRDGMVDLGLLAYQVRPRDSTNDLLRQRADGRDR
ncbi:hypothetical protein PtrCC142_010479, partial [Pyrenophora tritici-repentis]